MEKQCTFIEPYPTANQKFRKSIGIFYLKYKAEDYDENIDDESENFVPDYGYEEDEDNIEGALDDILKNSEI